MKMGKLGQILNSKEILANSELIKGLKVAIPKARSLEKKEIDALKIGGNYSSDWQKIEVLDSFQAERVRNTVFLGEVIIGKLEGEQELEGTKFPSGIYDSTLSDCLILGPVLIHRTKLLQGYIVKPGTVLYDAGMVTFQPESTMGNGVELSIAIEIGGREVKTFAEITVKIAEKIATNRKDTELLSEYDKFIQDYLSQIQAKKGVLSENCRIISTPQVKNVYLGPFSLIKGAQKVENSTILSNEDEAVEIKDGALVEDSIIQWGSEVASMGIVSESALTEHSHVERHGKVTQSLIGPNTGIGEGEVTASLVGPFVGFHHQALLIAAFWPEGKGNIAYGANVGSNHTSKAPDQEIFCGEGVFFGLGCNIKFPSNFRNAPYSLFASVVDALPQKVEFPFSLINTPAHILEGISPALNEIIPAWVLSDDLYMLRRNEGKYKKRNKAKRSHFTFEILRSDIVDLMIEARRRLLEVEGIKQVYTQEDIPGLGKCYLLEVNREKAIEAYTFFIRYYALSELKKMLEKRISEGTSSEELLSSSSPEGEEYWEHVRQVILGEFPAGDTKKLLKTLLQMEEKVCEMVDSSKKKDDLRGEKIIDDYSEVHILASDDQFVKENYLNAKKIKTEIQNLLKRI